MDDAGQDPSRRGLGFALRVGIWRDLDLRFLVPYVIRDVQDWSYAVNPAASTLANNTIDVSGCAGAIPTCTTVQPIVPADPIHDAPVKINQRRPMRTRPL